MKKIIATDKAPAAIGPYSQAVDCGSFLVTSGQVPFDPATGEFVPGGIAEQTRQQHEAAVAAGSKLIVHDIPLLVESGHWRTRLDGVLVVDCRESTQTERVMARSALTREAVQAIIDAQATRAQRLATADWVIYNDDGVTIGTLHA